MTDDKKSQTNMDVSVAGQSIPMEFLTQGKMLILDWIPLDH
ncbi:MAG: hypothetical protein ACTIDA_00565 [Pseudolactococcus laudensis]